MDRAVYERMDVLEAKHWWFAARREIIAALIGRELTRKPGARILEAGCGSGGNLDMLRRFGAVDAFEYDGTAREAAKVKSGLDIRPGALPQDVPFETERYDLIGLFDVLEHIDSDAESLAALAGRLGPDGKIIVTVPAFPFLWSRHDVSHHHFRRYTRRSLAEAAEKAGLRVRWSSYFNTLLFPLAIVTRAAKRLTGSDVPDDKFPAAPVNAALKRIFGSEKHLVPRVRMPFGLSLAAVLERA